MAGDSDFGVSGAIGFLQKKNRFYGWNKCLLRLDLHGLALLSPELMLRTKAYNAASPLPQLRAIGDIDAVDVAQAIYAEPKQLFSLQVISSVSAQGSKDISVATLSSGTLMLRAQTTEDRSTWLCLIQSAVASNALPISKNPLSFASESEPIRDQGPATRQKSAGTIPQAPPYIPTCTIMSCSADGLVKKAMSLSSGKLKTRIDNGGGNTTFSAPSTQLATNTPNELHCNTALAQTVDPFTPEPPLADGGSKLELDDFDASLFFNDAESSPEILALAAHQLASVASTTQSKDMLHSRPHNFTANPRVGTAAALPTASSEQLPAVPNSTLIAEAATATKPDVSHASMASANHSTLAIVDGTLGMPGSIDFGSIFDCILEPCISPTPNHAVTPVHSLATAIQTMSTTLATPQPPQILWQGGPSASGEKQLRSTSQRQPITAATPATKALQRIKTDNDDERPLGMATGSYKANQAESTHCYAHASDLAGLNAASICNAASSTYFRSEEPGVVLTSSVVDFTGSILDNIGLADWSHVLGLAPMSHEPTQLVTAPASNQTGPPDGSATLITENANKEQPGPEPKLLNSPDHHRLGSRTIEQCRSGANISGHGAGSRHQRQDGGGLSEAQAALLAKYSDSLSTSRSQLPNVGRASRPKPTHNWRTKTGGSDGRHIGERSATLVQYAPAEPVNTGVSKVIRGQLAKDIIQKEADDRPAVRRMRRVKSDIKVLPLKSIRLRLDGSVVGSHASISQTQSKIGRGSQYIVRDGHIEDASGRRGLRSMLTMSQQRLSAGQAANSGPGIAKSPNIDVFGEFNEIQARLRVAEDFKRQQQRAQLSDKEGADNVRIADIIENRQDIPLAAQLDERRKMQLAKQQVLEQQQLAQQKQLLEQQQQYVEQQRQHQLFKRQSLHPSLNSVSQMSISAVPHSGVSGGWTGYGGVGGSDAFSDQWMCQQSAHADAISLVQPRQLHRLHQQAQSVSSIQRPATAFICDSNAAWVQQRSGAVLLGNSTRLSELSCQSVDQYGRSLGGPPTTDARSQPGAGFIVHKRPASVAAQSLHSDASSGSWQSRANGSKVPSARATTELNYNGSEHAMSPSFSTIAPRRTSSYGYADHQRSASLRPGSLPARRRDARRDMKNVPPVPPLPYNGGVVPENRHPHGVYPFTSVQGPPEYVPLPVQGGHTYHQQAYSDQWPAGVPQAQGWSTQHGPLPPTQAVLARHGGYVPGYAGGGGGYPPQASNSQVLADMHKLSRKRTEMAANTPSLLQRLDNARTSGILPGRQVEKLGYSHGAYQNFNASRLIREGSSRQYLGDGSTLLIDRLHESEKSRSAFLKKISRSYTGIGGDVAPATTFTH
ncbi:hypothetical protein GGI02_000753 [Coemansia sp. RSA 2322]|nr:hypothetical protein GGI02_000753 [Coemansia sp. RSA 2322]